MNLSTDLLCRVQIFIITILLHSSQLNETQLLFVTVCCSRNTTHHTRGIVSTAHA